YPLSLHDALPILPHLNLRTDNRAWLPVRPAPRVNPVPRDRRSAPASQPVIDRAAAAPSAGQCPERPDGRFPPPVPAPDGRDDCAGTSASPGERGASS